MHNPLIVLLFIYLFIYCFAVPGFNPGPHMLGEGCLTKPHPHPLNNVIYISCFAGPNKFNQISISGVISQPWDNS
jgi:hypothetical protein